MVMTFLEVMHSETLLVLPAFPLNVYLTQRRKEHCTHMLKMTQMKVDYRTELSSLDNS